MSLSLLQTTIGVYKNTDDGETETSTCAACNNACPIATTESGAPGKTLSTLPIQYIAYIKTLQLVCNNADYDIDIVFDAVGAIGDRLQIFANAVSILDTGCVNGPGTVSTTVTIPAGTTDVLIQVTGACNGTPPDVDQWSLVISCAS